MRKGFDDQLSKWTVRLSFSSLRARLLLLLILVLLPAYAFILGLRVVAEGVETKEMFDAVAALGCDEAQGYFIRRPQECELLKGWFPTSAWKIRSDA